MRQIIGLCLIIATLLYPHGSTAQQCGTRSVTINSSYWHYASPQDAFAPTIQGEGTLSVLFTHDSHPVRIIAIAVSNTTTLKQIAVSINRLSHGLNAATVNLGSRLSPYYAVEIEMRQSERKCSKSSIHTNFSLDLLSATSPIIRELPCCTKSPSLRDG